MPIAERLISLSIGFRAARQVDMLFNEAVFHFIQGNRCHLKAILTLSFVFTYIISIFILIITAILL